MPAEAAADDRVAAVRRFNRFYTPLIGLLDEGYLDSPFTLTQVRVLYELARLGQATATELARDLSLDRGYLSRMLRGFVDLALIERSSSATDGRQRILSLTAAGLEVFERLDRRSGDLVAELLGRLSVSDQARLVGSMTSIERLLGKRPPGRSGIHLRPPGPGDLGWVVQRHGAIYAAEYGWDQTFEALVAEIVAGYGRSHDPSHEACWIAEAAGENVGSVFCVRRSDHEGQLRLLLVEPHARGLGVGRALVAECVAFATSAGYAKLVLWTNDVLVAARRIYEAAGFRLVEEERHHSFGHDLVGQNWELVL